MDLYGADKQRTISAGGSEQGGAVGEIDCRGEGDGDLLELVAFWAIAVAVGWGDCGHDRDFREVGCMSWARVCFS